MATAKYRNPGWNWDYTPSGAAVSANTVVEIGNVVGVVINDIADGELGAVSVRGVHSFTKDSATTEFAQGVPVYWDSTGDAPTETGTGNNYMGSVAKASGTADADVEIDLSPDGREGA